MWTRYNRFNLVIQDLEITTPGRICLFGEHQDYLGLPVIAMAISLRANISGYKRPDRQVIIHKPDIGEKEIFSLDDLDYNKPRDYFKAQLMSAILRGWNSQMDLNVKSKAVSLSKLEPVVHLLLL